MNFSSKLLENAVNELASLPGVGKKTALRFALYLLKQETTEVEKFGNAIIKLRIQIKHCKNCHNISDSELCEICSNSSRDSSLICVVEDVRDVMAIENTMQYKGLYHILGGIISPMDGIGPSDLSIESLVKKIAEGNIREIILALSASMEGDTTNFYINKRIKEFNVNVSTIARGISVGSDLEYTDEITLGRSIINRIPYEKK
jgi:recombination protein RecR